jgi:hypothetical protein
MVTANVMQNIANQRASVGQNLATLGQAGLTGAVGAANTQLAASQAPLSFFNSQYMNQLGAAPGYTIPNYSGTQGTSNNSTSTSWANVLSNLGL